jgi:3-isopropylmalate/(R)-2-methylmalate dehydratase small subunit
MEKFNRLIGVAAPFPVVNVDTDMIIPKDYMKTITRSGLGVGLFAELRYDDDGSPAPAFVLNKPRYRNAVILIVGANFGCGSSREHAPWALLDFGIRCLISTSFADIFYNNCFKNGILPIVVDTSLHSKLMNDASKRDGVISVDLEQQVIRAIDGSCHCFEIDGSRRETLLHGLDEIALTLQKTPQIETFEHKSKNTRPWSG